MRSGQTEGLSAHKKHRINEARQQDGALYYDEATESMISKHLLKNTVSSESSQSARETHHTALNDTLIDMLKNEFDTKNKQLEAKDKQIEELTATIRMQAESINVAHRNELAETIIDGNKLIEGGKTTKKARNIRNIFKTKINIKAAQIFNLGTKQQAFLPETTEKPRRRSLFNIFSRK